VICESCGAGPLERHDEGCLVPAGIAEAWEVLEPRRPRAASPKEARAVVALERASRKALAAWLRAGMPIGTDEQRRAA
jgi:hypothetical protein